MYRNFWKSTVCVENRRLFSKFSTFDGICRKSTAIFEIFDIFRYIPVYNGSRNGQNGSKYGRKLRYIIPEILTVDVWPSTFAFRQTVENVPNYSSFDFRLSRYNFTKLYQSSKALPKRMALVVIFQNSAVDLVGWYQTTQVKWQWWCKTAVL